MQHKHESKDRKKNNYVHLILSLAVDVVTCINPFNLEP